MSESNNISEDNKISTPEFKSWFKNPAEKKVKVKKEDRLIWAVCYAPFGFIAPYVMKRNSDFLSLHSKQWAIIFITFLLLLIILPFWFKGLIFLTYIGFAAYPAYQAFSWHSFQYKFINKWISKVKKFIDSKRK